MGQSKQHSAQTNAPACSDVADPLVRDSTRVSTGLALSRTQVRRGHQRSEQSARRSALGRRHAAPVRRRPPVGSRQTTDGDGLTATLDAHRSKAGARRDGTRRPATPHSSDASHARRSTLAERRTADGGAQHSKVGARRSAGHTQRSALDGTALGARRAAFVGRWPRSAVGGRRSALAGQRTADGGTRHSKVGARQVGKSAGHAQRSAGLHPAPDARHSSDAGHAQRSGVGGRQSPNAGQRTAEVGGRTPVSKQQNSGRSALEGRRSAGRPSPASGPRSAPGVGNRRTPVSARHAAFGARRMPLSALGARRSALGGTTLCDRQSVGAGRRGARPSAPAGRRSPVGARRSALAGRRSPVGARRSALAGRRSAVGARRSAVGGRRLALAGRRSAVGGWRLARLALLARGLLGEALLDTWRWCVVGWWWCWCGYGCVCFGKRGRMKVRW
ncbi:hypothetical protein FHU30_006350 [Actinomadura rupiterrae]|nr:hypothetical protein [Actinomadura rupiterrae]